MLSITLINPEQSLSHLRFQMNLCGKTAILFRIRNLEGEGGGISKRFDSEEQFRREALRNV